MTQKIDPGPWEPYADEAAHYSYVRCLELGRIYEAVRVTHEKDGGQAEFLHQVFFIAEYSEPELVEILRGFGYESLDAYVSELNQSGFVIGPDGKIDRRKSPAWYIDYMHLASLMAEHFEGRRMPAKTADRLARSIVGERPYTVEPIQTRQVFAGQLVSVPLSEGEMEMPLKRLCPPPEPVCRTACFYAWHDLDHLCSALLSGFFHRPVTAQAIVGASVENWELGLSAPISKEEQHALLNALQASDFDWDANDCGEYPVWGLSQGLSEKLIARMIPGPLEETTCSERGVWLICGKAEPECSAGNAGSTFLEQDELLGKRLLDGGGEQ